MVAFEQRHFAAQLSRERGIMNFIRRHGGQVTLDLIQHYFSEAPDGIGGDALTRRAIAHLEKSGQIRISHEIKMVYVVEE